MGRSCIGYGFGSRRCVGSAILNGRGAGKACSSSRLPRETTRLVSCAGKVADGARFGVFLRLALLCVLSVFIDSRKAASSAQKSMLSLLISLQTPHPSSLLCLSACDAFSTALLSHISCHSPIVLSFSRKRARGTVCCIALTIEIEIALFVALSPRR